MKTILSVAAMLSAMVLAGPASTQEAPPKLPAFTGIKLPVSDWNRATRFYTTFFGLKEGHRHNANEMSLEWPEPGHGPNLILYLDKCGTKEGFDPKLREQGRKIGGVTTKIVECTHAMKAGTAWLMFNVADAKKLAAALTAAKHPFTGPSCVEAYKACIMMLEDSEGNIIEVVQRM